MYVYVYVYVYVYIYIYIYIRAVSSFAAPQRFQRSAKCHQRQERIERFSTVNFDREFSTPRSFERLLGSLFVARLHHHHHVRSTLTNMSMRKAVLKYAWDGILAPR